MTHLLPQLLFFDMYYLIFLSFSIFVSRWLVGWLILVVSVTRIPFMHTCLRP